MRIIDAEWEAKANRLFIECDCGRRFKHRSTRWTVICPGCKKKVDLRELREKYREEHDNVL